MIDSDQLRDAMRRDVASISVPTPEEYFRNMVADNVHHPELELLPRPCGDCAVTSGFYQENSDHLGRQPADVQLAVSKKWYCHNAANKACRGNANCLGLTW